MAEEWKNVTKATIKGVQITQQLQQLVKAVKTIYYGAETGMTAAQATTSYTGAVRGIATVAVQESGMDQDAADAAAVAISAITIISYAVGYSVSSMSVVTAYISAAITAIKWQKRERAKHENLIWEGVVYLKFNDSYPYKYDISVEHRDSNVIGDISNDVEKSIREDITSKINKALTKLKKRDSDFVLRFAARPKEKVRIRVDAGNVEQSNIKKKFGRKMAEELEEVQKEIKKSATAICNLHFLAAMGAKDLVEKEAINRIPSIKYKAEGAWRKELERLAIKLMQRREYTRQIDLVLHAMIVDGMLKHNHGRYPGQEFVIKPSRTVKRKADEGKSYVEGNIPRISLHANKLDTPNPGGGGDYVEARTNVEIHCNFKVVPEFEGNSIGFRIKSISGNTIYKHNVRRKTDPYRHRPFGHSGIRSMSPTYKTGLPGNFAQTIKNSINFANYLIGEIPREAAKYVYNEVGTTDAYCRIKISSSAEIDRIESNYPAQLNAQMQDVIDLYKFWQKGYAEEFKRRKRKEILDNMLPQVREAMEGRIQSLTSTYADLPRAQATSELAMKTMKLIEEQHKEVSEYVPQIKESKDYIVRMFGRDEYEKILGRANKRQQQLIIEYINESRDVASQEALNKKFGEGMQVSPKEFDTLVEITYSTFKQKHPDLSVTKQQIRKQLSGKVNVKKEQPKEEKPKAEEPKPETKPKPKEEAPQQAVEAGPGGISQAWENFGTVGKVAAVGGAGLLLSLLLSEDEQGRTIIIRKK